MGVLIVITIMEEGITRTILIIISLSVIELVMGGRQYKLMQFYVVYFELFTSLPNIEEHRIRLIHCLLCKDLRVKRGIIIMLSVFTLNVWTFVGPMCPA